MYSKKIILAVSVFSLLIFILPTISFAEPSDFIQRFNPYIGLEYSQRSLNMVEGYGKGLFVKRLPQGDLLVGLKLNDYIGVEAGYLFSQATTRTAYSTEGTQIFKSLLLLPDEMLVTNNTINLFGPHITISAYLPIGTTPFYGIGSVGFTLMTLKARSKPLGDAIQFVYTADDVEGLTRHFSSKKLVHRIMGGMGYKINDNIGIRLLFGYEMTFRFKNISPKEVSSYKMSLKNNTIGNLGLNYSF
jgi:hypothetical protein